MVAKPRNRPSGGVCFSELEIICATKIEFFAAISSVSACRSLNRLRRAADRAQVEHHRGQHLRHRVGPRDPAAEIVAPDPHRLAPARVGRHHVAGAIDIAAGVQPVARRSSPAARNRPCRPRSRHRRSSGSCPDRRRRSVPAAPGCRRPATDRAPAAGPSSASAIASRRRVTVSAMSVISRVTTSCA